MSNKKESLIERLEKDVVLVAEGYIFELERRGYLKAGPFVPEVVLEHPEAVINALGARPREARFILGVGRRA